MERNSEQLSLISNQFQYDDLKTREENLAAFAKAIVANQTFDLCTWEDTVACMYLADDRVVYNRITLCTMDSTLTKAEYKLLLDCMAREINARDIYYNKGDCTKRREYISLFSYMELREELKEYRFQKHERPDFVLSNGTKSIGIEITVFTTENAEKGRKILQHGGNDVNEMQKYASNKFPDIAANCRFIMLGGPVIQYPEVNITNAHSSFRDKLIEKIHKYNDEEINQYDEFIILCDATAWFAIGEQSDVEDILHPILELSGNHNNNVRLKVSILYTANWSGKKELYECSFDASQH